MGHVDSPTNPRALDTLVVTMGDPGGIGGEVALKAWLARNANLPPFFLLDCPNRLKAIAAQLKLDVPICPISKPDKAKAIFGKGLPVLPLQETTGLPSAHLGTPHTA